MVGLNYKPENTKTIDKISSLKKKTSSFAHTHNSIYNPFRIDLPLRVLVLIWIFFL